MQEIEWYIYCSDRKYSTNNILTNFQRENFKSIIAYAVFYLQMPAKMYGFEIYGVRNILLAFFSNLTWVNVFSPSDFGRKKLPLEKSRTTKYTCPIIPMTLTYYYCTAHLTIRCPDHTPTLLVVLYNTHYPPNHLILPTAHIITHVWVTRMPQDIRM